MRCARLLAVFAALATGLAMRCGAATPPPDLVAGPYLTNLGPDRVTVSWQTGKAAPGAVEVEAGERRWVVEASGDPTPLRHVVVTGLPAATMCSYRVRVGDRATPSFRFTTAPGKPAPFRFAAYGDSRLYAARHRKVAEGIRKHRPAFVIHAGDFVNYGPAPEEWPVQFFAPARELLRECPILTAIGNHEEHSSLYYSYFSIPGRGGYFNRRYGGVELFILNSCVAVPGDGEQCRWLARGLAASRARWKIVVAHHPLFSSGRHGPSEPLRHALIPLFIKHGVDLAITSHDHIYERSPAIGLGADPASNAFVHVVTGGGGAPIYAVRPGPWCVKSLSTLHFCIFDVTRDSIRATVRNEKGEVIDQFVLSKREGRRDFGPAVSAASLELLIHARDFAKFRFPRPWRRYHSARYAFTVKNPYAEPVVGELSWELGGKVWTVDEQRKAIRVAPGGELKVAFPVGYERPATGPAVPPVPKAVLTSGALRAVVPAFEFGTAKKTRKKGR